MKRNSSRFTRLREVSDSLRSFSLQVQEPAHHVKHMVPSADYGWSENKWSTPWDLPASYMTPAVVQPGQITTSVEDRLYGTVRGDYPEHVRRRRAEALLERSQSMDIGT